MKTSLNPKDNYSQGKVKFLQGGGGSPPVVENVVPLLIGSNFYNQTYFNSFVELPLNVTLQVTQGSQNKTFIVQDVVSGFRSWFVNSNLQLSSIGGGFANIDAVVQLVIDGVTQDTQTITMLPPLGIDIYRGEVNFNFETSPISITQSIYYRIDLSVSNVAFRPNTTTLIYSSLFGEGLRYNGFLSSNFQQLATIIDNNYLEIAGNFGGSAYNDTNEVQPIKNALPIPSMTALGIYFSLGAIEVGNNLQNTFLFTLVVDGVEIQLLTSELEIFTTSTFYFFPFDTPYTMSENSTIYLKLSFRYLLADASATFEQVGLIYRAN